MDWSDIIVALIGSATTLSAAYLATKYKRLQKTTADDLAQSKAELTFQAQALSFEDFIHEWSDIHKELVELLRSTPIDRFLMLRAWNGKSEPKWATAFFQLRLGDQEPFTYQHVELDHDYIDRLRKAVDHGWIVFTVNSIEERSLIKNIYNTEGVKQSVWFHIMDYSVANSSSKAIMYCSFATHGEEQITAEHITKAQMIVYRIKAMANEAKKDIK